MVTLPHIAYTAFDVGEAQEELKLHLKGSDSMMEHLDTLMNMCMVDFLNDDNSTFAEYAARIAHVSITEQTQVDHLRNLKWDAMTVISQTPNDICLFITQELWHKGGGF
ncbi:hypothetical protein PILCRDRAFT_92929 [Piloderma croceum F 1598]|uniref:Uncharacterized protein n=1 Tax=Piloderma croceum (strain F 1598) TaxID=765440 RepID=A0A0C3B8U5_PILCF|nr:hypothetical protein PILCRDRAFT_92929 [Piloderma croceum F 1598]